MSTTETYNKLDSALCIADLFHRCVKEGIFTITTREILWHLGIKNPNFEYENKEFDLTTLINGREMETWDEIIFSSPSFNGREKEAA